MLRSRFWLQNQDFGASVGVIDIVFSRSICSDWSRHPKSTFLKSQPPKWLVLRRGVIPPALKVGCCREGGYPPRPETVVPLLLRGVVAFT